MPARRMRRIDRSSLLREMGDIEIDRERDHAGEAQAAPDAASPQLDAVLPGVGGGEMVARAARRARQRRGDDDVLLAQLVERRQRLAPLRLVMFMLRLAHTSKHKLPEGLVPVDALA